MKRTLLCAILLSLALLCSACGAPASTPSADGVTSATAQMLPLRADVTLRTGTEPDGTVILQQADMEGFFASDHYTDESPYGFALVLTADGKKQLRNATRELAKEQAQITLWANGEALCSPTVTTVLNTKYVILNIASVKDAESYQHVVSQLQAP